MTALGQLPPAGPLCSPSQGHLPPLPLNSLGEELPPRTTGCYPLGLHPSLSSLTRDSHSHDNGDTRSSSSLVALRASLFTSQQWGEGEAVVLMLQMRNPRLQER